MRKVMLAAVLLTGAAQADAAAWLVTVQGFLNNGAGPVTGVPFGGQYAQAGFIINGAVAPVTLPPIGGQGTATMYPFAVVGFGISVGGYGVTATGNAMHSAFVYDNGAPPSLPPTLRFDQFSLSYGFSFGPGFLPHLATTAPLPADVFLSSFNFGRSVVAPAPTLINGSAFPDLGAVFAPQQGVGTFFAFNFRRGVPTSGAQVTTLPGVTFSMLNPQVQVTPISLVPEPASWAMMIAGFGLVGAAARRRVRAVQR
ncbi:PEPxxWA-CTERM sorting domain-containing protein [Sandaracinobacteroides saxicola]|uniref:PEPxxWA-CTERM sorting domain-containing protein n=1 Tax=Sandaracinobacteroides saxicola TaxID=2759707 RepID=UPI001FB0CC7C|nr:PEPxxWA-CTERM sorting domain-containing protein [Sandaracinobacteroides saxicola]